MRYSVPLMTTRGPDWGTNAVRQAIEVLTAGAFMDDPVEGAALATERLGLLLDGGDDAVDVEAIMSVLGGFVVLSTNLLSDLALSDGRSRTELLRAYALGNESQR
ncbi:MAG: hypothetical protein QOJ11_3091 [Frankiales bacterium]|jgi:hypothetical protein|nr:hypothetical protein [Frankiales bacterium]